QHAPREVVVQVAVGDFGLIVDVLLVLEPYLEGMGPGDVGRGKPLGVAVLVVAVEVSGRRVIPEVPGQLPDGYIGRFRSEAEDVRHILSRAGERALCQRPAAFGAEWVRDGRGGGCWI